MIVKWGNNGMNILSCIDGPNRIGYKLNSKVPK